MAGTITNRGPRTWLIRIDLDRDPVTGKRGRHTKTIHGTRKDAEAYMHKKLTERDTGTWQEPSKEIMSAYLSRWLEDSASTRIALATKEMYRGFISRYVVEASLGRMRLDRVAPLDVKAFHRCLADRGLGPARISRVHGMIRSALQEAVAMRLIQNNPASLARPPKVRNAEMQALTEAEAIRFLAEASLDRHEVIWAFMLETGARPGEALALRWQDVDLGAATATIKRSMTWLEKGEYVFHDTKTEGSVRMLPLSSVLVRTLRRHRIEQAKERLAAGSAWLDHDLVFATEAGTPHRRENLSKRHLKPILKAANLPATFRIYDLRHTCATLLLTKGVNIKVVAERLGHAGTRILLDRYAHVLPGMQERATAELGFLLYGHAGGRI